MAKKIASKSVASHSTVSVAVSKETTPATAPAVTPVSQTTAANPTATSTSLPLATRIPLAVPLLDQLIALFQEDAVDLTALDKKRGVKARKGSAKVISIIAEAAKQMGVSLSLAPIAPMEESSAEAQSLAPIQAKMAVLDKLVSDRVFLAEGSAWSNASKLYVVLARLAKGNGQLQQLLEPAREFFSYRHKAVKKAAAAVTEAPATPPPTPVASAVAPAASH